MFSVISLMYRRIRPAVLLAVLMVVIGCGPKPAGVSYQHEKVSNVPWSIHIVKFDRSHRDLELRTTLARETGFGLTTLPDQIRALPPQVGTPVAPLNGDFYVVEAKHPYLGDPRGLQILDGELISAPGDEASFWIDATGQPL